MAKVTIFKNHQLYDVIENYSEEPGEWRLDTMCYDLNIGDRLRFEGWNLGYAKFTKDGLIVLLTPKIAFRVIGNLTNHFTRR